MCAHCNFFQEVALGIFSDLTRVLVGERACWCIGVRAAASIALRINPSEDLQRQDPQIGHAHNVCQKTAGDGEAKRETSPRVAKRPNSVFTLILVRKGHTLGPSGGNVLLYPHHPLYGRQFLGAPLARCLYYFSCARGKADDMLKLCRRIRVSCEQLPRIGRAGP